MSTLGKVINVTHEGTESIVVGITAVPSLFNTATIPNGEHVLTVCAESTDGLTVEEHGVIYISDHIISNTATLVTTVTNHRGFKQVSRGTNNTANMRDAGGLVFSMRGPGGISFNLSRGVGTFSLTSITKGGTAQPNLRFRITSSYYKSEASDKPRMISLLQTTSGDLVRVSDTGRVFNIDNTDPSVNDGALMYGSGVVTVTTASDLRYNVEAWAVASDTGYHQIALQSSTDGGTTWADKTALAGSELGSSAFAPSGPSATESRLSATISVTNGEQLRIVHRVETDSLTDGQGPTASVNTIVPRNAQLVMTRSPL